MTPELAAGDAVCGTLVSLNVGKPKNMTWNGSTLFTGIFKSPVAGPRMVRRLNVDGDGQGDLNGHGGEQRAVLVYQRESYAHWAEHLRRDDLVPGNFGENFTVEGLPDDEVCIGDRFRIGEAVFEVTQPRVTCFRVGMRLGEPEMPSMLVAHGRPGFYLRVIEEGVVSAGDFIIKTRSGRHQLSVAATDALLYLPGRSEEHLRKAVDIPALSPGWQQSFRELLEAYDRGAVTIPAVGEEPTWDGFRPMRVAKTVVETPTITSVYLAADVPVPTSVAGQHLTLRIPTASGTTVRSYSVSAMPDERTYRISVRCDEHGLASRHIHDVVRAGDTMDVAAPRGEFVLQESNAPVLFVSAGIGATPVLSMLLELVKVRSTRRVWWIHTARSPEEHVFRDEARALVKQLGDACQLTIYTRMAPPGAVSGRMTHQRLSELDIPADAVAYVCGPSGFIQTAWDALIRIGLSEQHIHTELFGSVAALTPGIVGGSPVVPHPPAGPEGTGPSVTFARSGIAARWRDSETSLLELAEACDIPTRWSCRTGVCHTCVTHVVAGSVSYRPAPLEEPPAGQILLCCARPNGELVLDA